MLFSMFHETLMVLIVKFPPFVVIHQPAFNITMHDDMVSEWMSPELTWNNEL